MFLLLLSVTLTSHAHDVASAEKEFLETLSGPQPIPYLYLGAKHMVTGLDHLLYLLGIVLLLSRSRDVLVYVSLFALGHSVTLVSGVLIGIELNARLIDALIGLSVSYKAIENLGGFRSLFSFWPDPRIAVFGFGLIHGLGLATKLQSIAIGKSGLLYNLIAFNVGVELGQSVALFPILALINLGRSMGFGNGAQWLNILLMSAGFLLFMFHAYGYHVNA